MVERYRLTGYDFGTEPHSDGAWVAYHAYADLERQIAELRAERVTLEERLATAYQAKYRCNEDANAERRINRLLSEALEKIEDVDFDGYSLSELHEYVTDIARAALSGSGAGGWREITDDDQPPLDTDVIMGCWETFPKPRWTTEIGHYGSKRGGWIHGRMTHWLPLDRLPAAPTATGGR